MAVFCSIFGLSKFMIYSQAGTVGKATRPIMTKILIFPTFQQALQMCFKKHTLPAKEIISQSLLHSWAYRMKLWSSKSPRFYVTKTESANFIKTKYSRAVQKELLAVLTHLLCIQQFLNAHIRKSRLTINASACFFLKYAKASTYVSSECV